MAKYRGEKSFSMKNKLGFHHRSQKRKQKKICYRKLYCNSTYRSSEEQKELYAIHWLKRPGAVSNDNMTAYFFL